MMPFLIKGSQRAHAWTMMQAEHIRNEQALLIFFRHFNNVILVVVGRTAPFAAASAATPSLLSPSTALFGQQQIGGHQAAHHGQHQNQRAKAMDVEGVAKMLLICANCAFDAPVRLLL